MEKFLYAVPILMFAGVVRGYSGFGFAAASIVGMNLLFEPHQSVAIILSLNFICSIGVWKSAIDDADYKIFRRLLIGAIMGIPLGYLCLLLVPSEILKFLICCSILVLSLLLYKEYKLTSAHKIQTQIGIGITSGIGTSSASVGGPMIVYYMLSSGLSIPSQRATMILYFLVSETIALLSLIFGGMVDQSVPKAVAILVIPTLLAVNYGQKLFKKNPPKSLKSFALPVLLVVSILGLVNSGMKLYQMNQDQETALQDSKG